MAASVASFASSLHVSSACCCSSSDSKLLPRHGLAPSSVRACPPLSLVSNGSRVIASAASKKGLDFPGPAALALLAAAIIPEIAEAAQPGVSPSLKNLLLSVLAGGVVLVVLGGAVAAVSTFDPVKRK